MSEPRPMVFKRHGRSYHLVLTSVEDLEQVLKLDEALWVATGAPIEGLNADPVLLDLVDSDNNKRILCGEMKDAIRWVRDAFKDYAGVSAASATLKMSTLNLDHPDAKRIFDSHQSVRKLLSGADAPTEDEVTLDQVRAMKAKVEATPVSELGVVLPEAAKAHVAHPPSGEAVSSAQPGAATLHEAAKDAELATFIADIVATMGGAPHPAGRSGADQAQLDRFLAASRSFLDWCRKNDIPAGQTRTDIMPLGADTPAAWAAFAALRAKIDLYFQQCRAVELDARLAERMYPSDAELDALNLGDLAAVEKILKDAPCARPTRDRVLPLVNVAQPPPAGSLSDVAQPPPAGEKKHTGEGACATSATSATSDVNPYYAVALAELRARVVEPLLGRAAEVVSEADWDAVNAALAAHEAWLAAKPSEAVGTLGEAKLTRYLEPKFRLGLEALIAQAPTTAFVLNNIRLTEKAVLYQSNIILLANNFVSFPDLYEENRHALLEEGALVMDGRRFNLAVKVTNRGAHVDVAKTGSMFVVYVSLVNRHDGRTKEVAMPVVAGGRGNLNVGKRGLFVDFTGDEWDAQVVQVIENPISLIEAILSPFTRLGKMVTGKIESASANAEAKLQAKALQHPGATGAAPAPAAGPAAAPAPAGGGAMTMVMGGSVALAALGAGAAYITTALKGVPWWQIAIGIAAAVIVLLSPLMLLAILKLRKRDLSAILEGSGWAINARMRLTRHQCGLFTQKPPYPKDAEGIRRATWWIVAGAAAVAVVVALGVGWYYLATSPMRRALPSSASDVVEYFSDVRPAYTHYLKAKLSEKDFEAYCDKMDLTPLAAAAAEDNTTYAGPPKGSQIKDWETVPAGAPPPTFAGKLGDVHILAWRLNGWVYVKSVAGERVVAHPPAEKVAAPDNAPTTLEK